MIPDWMFVILEILILFVGFCFGRLSVKSIHADIFNKPTTKATPPIIKAIRDPQTLTDTKINPAITIKNPPIINPKQAKKSSLLNIRSIIHFPIKWIKEKK